MLTNGNWCAYVRGKGGYVTILSMKIVFTGV